MASRLVTCPETAHLERIEFDDSPFGWLILGCSRFEASCAVTCSRTCAARFDARARYVAAESFLDVGDTTSVDVLARCLRRRRA